MACTCMWLYSHLTTKKLQTEVYLYFHGIVIGPFQRFLFGPPLPLAECKYQFQAWGECDLNTALKTRTGSLKRALHNADCQKTVTISKPCGKLTKPKPQGGFLPSHHKGNMNGLVDSGRSFRCGNSNFPEGNLRWITFRKELKKLHTLSITQVLFQQTIDGFKLESSA